MHKYLTKNLKISQGSKSASMDPTVCHTLSILAANYPEQHNIESRDKYIASDKTVGKLWNIQNVLTQMMNENEAVEMKRLLNT